MTDEVSWLFNETSFPYEHCAPYDTRCLAKCLSPSVWSCVFRSDSLRRCSKPQTRRGLTLSQCAPDEGLGKTSQTAHSLSHPSIYKKILRTAQKILHSNSHSCIVIKLNDGTHLDYQPSTFPSLVHRRRACIGWAARGSNLAFGRQRDALDKARTGYPLT